ncbi:MAG: hypothetical protein IIY86_02270 [Lachnospiraceae bacterium]|nr:hypothetical protein [Lachnospiraceae bacterium]
MKPVDYMLHRDEIEKANYERLKAFEALEARWPKWIKRSSWIIWLVFVLIGFLVWRAFGAMLGFVIGGSFTILYEKICRKIVGKKLGIEDISYKEAVKDIVERQNREYREREAQRIAEENARIEAELAAQLEAEEKAAAEAYKE